MHCDGRFDFCTRQGRCRYAASQCAWVAYMEAEGLPRGLAVAVLKPLLYEILMERTVFIESCR